MRRNIIDAYPSVKDLDVILKHQLDRKESQEFLRDSQKTFVHTNEAAEVADMGKHLFYNRESLLRLKRDLSAQTRGQKSTAFVVESEASLDELEGDLSSLKDSDEVFDEDSDLRITDTQRDEHSIKIEVGYVHREVGNRTLMDSESRNTSFRINETEEDDEVYKVTQTFHHADEFDAAKNLFSQWDRRRRIDGDAGVTRTDIRIEAITPLEDRVDFFDEFLTYNPNNWDTRNVQHLGVRQAGDQEDNFEETTAEGDELEEQIDRQLSNISELALTGRSLRDNPIVEKCIENDFYFDVARIYCENTEEPKGAVIELKFKRQGRNAFDLTITREYQLEDGERKKKSFGLPFRKQTRREFRDAVVDLYGQYKDMEDLVNERGESYSFDDLPGVGSKTAENIEESDFDSVSELLDAEKEELVEEIDGIGETTAEKILSVDK
jgi:hypothetical protein